MKRLMWTITALVAVAVFFPACNKSDSGSGPDNNVNGFDKTAMLKQYADSIIVPGYAAMKQALLTLNTASNKFLAAPSVAAQAEVKSSYSAARLQYQRIAALQFGPAETELLDAFLNFSGGLDYSFTTAGELTGFSVDTAAIEKNISSRTYSLTAMTRSSFYSQGFAALDYLYFAPDAISKLAPPTPGYRIIYIQEVLTRMEMLVDKVAANWIAYRADFIANTKTNVGSPIGNMVNQLAYQMDLLKGPRIGWPFGKQSNGIAFPKKVEAYYAGISVALAVENLANLKRVYTAGGSGKGLSDYLVALDKAALNKDVLAQFDVTLAKLSAIPDPLSLSLTARAADVDAAYKEIQKLLTLLKTDVASATAVQITFMDNDGD